jgi:thioredoxin 1
LAEEASKKIIINGRNGMRVIICFILIALLASIGAGMTATATAAHDPVGVEQANLGTVIGLNDSTVSEALNEYPLFVLDCYVSWCEPCKDLNMTFDELSDELKDQVAFGSINIENNRETADRYGIVSYPTILFIKNGTLVDSQVGYGSESELVMRLQMIESDLNLSNVRTNEMQAMPVLSPSDIMQSNASKNIRPDKMQIMPSPAPAAFRQFVENASKDGNSSASWPNNRSTISEIDNPKSINDIRNSGRELKLQSRREGQKPPKWELK